MNRLAGQMKRFFKHQIYFSPRFFYDVPWGGYLIFLVAVLILIYRLLSLAQWTPDTDNPLYGKVIQAEGTVSEFVISRGDRDTWYFNFDIHSINGESNRGIQRVRLSWYDVWSRSTLMPKLGESWVFWIKLKAVNGYSNPGGFDYERWAFSQRIHSAGYVHSEYLSLPAVENDYQRNVSLIDRLRENIRDAINKIDMTASTQGLVKALILGDRSGISSIQWEAFRRTGTVHLLAISGLHIGLSAFFIGIFCSFIWRRSSRLCRILPAPYIFSISGILGALLYTMISGMGTPAVRAFLMIFFVFLGLLSRRFIPMYVSLSLAFFVLLMIDIRAFFSASFWLSFLAVSIIVLVLLKNDQQELTNPSMLSFKHKVGSWGKKTIRLQLALTIGMIPVLLFFFQQASWVAPVANLIVTPLLSLVVIPYLLCVVLITWYTDLFPFLMYPAALSLGWINDFLLAFQSLIDGSIRFPSPSLWVTILSSILFMSVFFLKGIKQRMMAGTIGVLLLFPFSGSVAFGELEITLLDVKQGLSVVLRTENKTLIYDTGKPGVGKQVIEPFMRKIWRQADLILVSHHDIDHYGGLKYVDKIFPNAETLNWQNCGKRWIWDGVLFESYQIEKSKTSEKIKDNNLSCVLKVTAKGGQSFLITGDIEKTAELSLIKQHKSDLFSDVLLVPHQGSITSSNERFIEVVNPKYALISAGFMNQFGHPHPEVMDRYRRSGIPMYSTICSGAITFMLRGENKPIEFSHHRVEHGYFWNRQCQS